jgi:hypothetical protein
MPSCIDLARDFWRASWAGLIDAKGMNVIQVGGRPKNFVPKVSLKIINN